MAEAVLGTSPNALCLGNRMGLNGREAAINAVSGENKANCSSGALTKNSLRLLICGFSFSC